MGDGSVFPSFLKLEYQPSGSAKASFLAEMASISGDAKRQFENAFGDINQTITKSLSSFKNGGFKFEVDVSGLRQAAADADFTAQRLTALRDAGIALAASTGDTSQATHSYLQALRAQAIEANRARDAAVGQVDVYQRLQGEIDKTVAGNTRLAESYRATFAEQAKAANAAFEFQQKLNSGFGLTRTSDAGYGFAPTKSARDSASVFETQSYAPRADTRSGLDRLMSGQASIDKAALSGATLESVLGRVSTKGREVAASLQEAERAAEALAATRLAENEAALAKAAAEAKSFAAAAVQLRAQLDPAVAIQQKFDAELTNAERLLSAGAISQKEYAQAVTLAQRNLSAGWADLTRTQEENIRVTKRGTSETSNVINGVRAQRVAFTQLGQQMQDVVVQTQMGTNATTIFVQQVPQMAFALSGLAESTNKTYSRIGQFASFLAGPLGTAVFVAAAVLGPLAAGLLSAGDEADNAKGKTYDFSQSLDVMTLSADRGAEAMHQLAAATRGAIAVQGDFLANQSAIAAASVASLQAELTAEQRKLAAAKANRFSLFPTDGDSTVSREFRIGSLEANIPKLQASLADARQSQINAEIATSQRRVNESRDAGVAATNRYNAAVGELNKRFEASKRDPLGAGTMPGYLDQAGYEREYARLTDDYNAAKEKDKESKRKPKADHSAEKASREAERLANFSDKAAESIQRVNERFNEQPKLVDQAAQSTRQLDDIIADLEKRQPANFKDLIAEAEKAKGVIQDALVRPFRDMAQDSERRAQVQDLLSRGMEAEAAAVQEIWRLEQQLGPLTAERKAEVLAITAAEQKHIEALQRVQQIQSAYLDATRSVRQEVEAILGGYGKISNLKGIFQQLQGRILTEKLFGDVFRDMDKWVKEKTGIGSSVDMMAKEVERSGASWPMGDMRPPDLLARPYDPANDNHEIVVVAKKPAKPTVNDLTPEQYFERMSAKLAKPMIDAISGVSAGLGKALGGPITGALEGYLTTGTGFGAVLGGLKDIKGLPESLTESLAGAFKGAQTGNMVAGIGNMLGLGMSNTGSQIGGALGSFLPIPGGDIIGSIVGGFLGKLFGKRPRGSGSVTQSGVSASANDAGIQDALGGFGDSLQGSISKIASALGAQIGSYSVGIGRYKDYYQVSGVGNDPVLGNSYFGRDSANALYDGQDEEAAMRAAILNALQDGAIKGIREGAIRLLKAGKDLDAQIQKALDFQNVFKELKQIKDPVGAALDDLNTEFEKLKTTFTEAGATAAEMADLEELYGIKRAKAIKDANSQILGSLQDLMKSLTIDNSTRSLRDREAEALKAYQPLEARVKAGDTTAFADFSQAAKDLLDIQRQLYGSQAQYFTSEDAIKSITQSAIDKAQKVADEAANRDSPFKSTGTAAANDNASVTSALGSLQSGLLDGLGGRLDAVNQNLGALIQQGLSRGSIVPQYAFAGKGSW